jgi:ethanolamine utilization microcompartment shell protein EutL
VASVVFGKDQRIESFLTDVLALAGEDRDAVREGVRVALADCEAISRVREDNKRMKGQAARVCRAGCLASSRRCITVGEPGSRTI